MKALSSLLIFNFLCVWCFGFEECEDDDVIICPEISRLDDGLPYLNQETVFYQTEAGISHDRGITRRFNSARDQCMIAVEEVNISFAPVEEPLLLNVRLVALGEGESGVDISVSPASTVSLQTISFRMDSTNQPVDSSVGFSEITDTTLNGVAYERLFAFALVPDDEAPLSRLYYDKKFGVIGLVWEGWPSVFRRE